MLQGLLGPITMWLDNAGSNTLSHLRRIAQYELDTSLLDFDFSKHPVQEPSVYTTSKRELLDLKFAP
jgi:hypothetical protein